MSKISLRSFVLTALFVSASGQALAAASRFDTVLKPVREGQPEVTAIEVRSTLDAEAGRPLAITAPIIYPGAWKVAERIKDLKVTDADGEVPLAATDDPAQPGGFPYYRHWKAQRAVKYPVTIAYRALVQPVGDRNGPPFGMRAVAGGVSGSLAGFMATPEELNAADLRLKWDVSDLAAGSTGETAFGEGDVSMKGGSEKLIQAWYMAGPVGRYPASGVGHGFSGVWLGAGPFDPAKEMAWSANLYGYLAKSFKYLEPAPDYRIFMRFLDTAPVGGATALPGAFMLSRAAAPFDPKAEGPRETFAHEMIHQWTGGIEAPQGVSSWFSEGLTTYYTSLLPLRGGFTTVDEFTQEINDTAKGYYGSPARDWTAAKIAESGFSTETIRHVPYMRTATYLADLDARIRARSKGKRKLDDMLAPMFVSREKGVRFDHASWKAMVVKELGPLAAVEFEDRILEGKPWTPVANAYGPCFIRVARTYEVDGKPVEGFGWDRVKGVPDATCKRW